MWALYDAGRWGFLLDMIDNLPRNSATVQAKADDEELAALLPGSPKQSAGTPLSEWSTAVELLAAIFDRIGELASDGQVKPWPRPVVAAQRMQARQRKQLAEEVAAKLWPKKDNN